MDMQNFLKNEKVISRRKKKIKQKKKAPLAKLSKVELNIRVVSSKNRIDELRRSRRKGK